MPIITDRLLHLHNLAGEACYACGDPDDGTHIFIRNPRVWNREKRNCSPKKIFTPLRVLTDRDRSETSALKDERKASRKKVPDGY